MSEPDNSHKNWEMSQGGQRKVTVAVIIVAVVLAAIYLTGTLSTDVWDSNPPPTGDQIEPD